MPSSKELRQLPGVSGDNFSLLAEAFRDFVLGQQDDHDAVVEVLVDLIGWDRDDAKWVFGVLNDGLGHIYDTATDPRAAQYKKDSTVVRRKRRG